MDPELCIEGNCRLVTAPCEAWPDDPVQAVAAVDEHIVAGKGQPYGPIHLLAALPPDDGDPEGWHLRIGRACTGLVPSRSPILVEDYSSLTAVVLPHYGPIKDLHRTHRSAVDHARTRSWRLRPYWRISLTRRATPDGQGLLTTEVAVFVDR
jgi:hypothetical protein